MADFRRDDNPTRAGGATASGPLRRRTQGFVVDCDGARAVIMAHVDKNVDYMENYWAVGQLVSIQEGANRIVGQTYHVESAEAQWSDAGVNTLLIHIELVGEIRTNRDGRLTFSTGIADYPRMGAIAHRIRASDLEAMHHNDGDMTISVGHLAQEPSIAAKVDLDRLTSRHFAIVGSTGTGKSTSVTLILHKIIAQRPDMRVLILDPHNEFSSAFMNEAMVQDANSLTLPFWLFTFEEFREIVFRGQKGLDSEAELLRDMISEAKQRYEGDARAASTLVKRNAMGTGFTADSPVPYRLADLFKVIDERLGQLDGKAIKPTLKVLRDRLVTISEDPRFAFTFSQPNAGGDRMREIVGDLFRVPHDGKPISVVDMSELPSEVVNSVASVLCRMAFDLAVASQGAIQTLVVCEEAHRYVPASQDAGFWPTRQAVARIAKEGRKYGVYLGMVTQRPSELDPTILSQCNTIFAMRLANQNDQKIIGDAMTNGAQTSINFISSLADRECIAFGEALKTPMRMVFETIPPENLPGSRIKAMQQQAREGHNIDLSAVIRRMRESNTRTQQAEHAYPAEDRHLPQREAPGLATEVEPRSLDRDSPAPGREPVGTARTETPTTDAPRKSVDPVPESHTQPAPQRSIGKARKHDPLEPMEPIENWSGSRVVGKRSDTTSSAREPSSGSLQSRGNSLVQAFRTRH